MTAGRCARGGGHRKRLLFNDIWGRLPLGAFPLETGAVGVAMERMHSGADGEEERIGGGEVVDAAGEVAVVAGNGVVEESRLEGGEFLDPLHEEEVAGERLPLGRILHGFDGGTDDGCYALLPHGVDGELAGIEMVGAGVAAGASLAGRSGRPVRFAAIGAIGGDLLFRDANE